MNPENHEAISGILIRILETASRDALPLQTALFAETTRYVRGDGWILASICEKQTAESEPRFHSLEAYQVFPEISQNGRNLPVSIDPVAGSMGRVLDRICTPPDFRKKTDPTCFDVFSQSENGQRSELIIFRGNDTPPFEENRKKTAVDLLRQMPWLTKSRGGNESTNGGLSPRLAYVCKLLVQGLDRKTIAQKAGLSIHTVGDYTKEIYRYYEVHSQPELIGKYHDAPLIW